MAGSVMAISVGGSVTCSWLMFLALPGGWMTVDASFSRNFRQLPHAEDQRVRQALRRCHPQFALAGRRVGRNGDAQRKGFGQHGAEEAIGIEGEELDRISVISCHTAAFMGCFCSSCMRSRRVVASLPFIGRAWSGDRGRRRPQPET
jgi:hypothetical protein